jgi:hypothetical protein
MEGRLSTDSFRSIGAFAPWWVKCRDCSSLAVMKPNWDKRICGCKCKHCGALYQIPISPNYVRQIVDLPLWLKANFRRKVFWAVNGEHLDYLEQVIGATLRERPIVNGRRLPLTTSMPFNLPSWILSAKNRRDLLRVIKKLKRTIPAEMLKGE